MNNINGDYDVQMWKCHKEMPYFMLICTNNKIFLILRSLMNNHNTVE